MAVGVTSSIVIPHKRDDTIDDGATVKNGEAVFTYSSPPFFSSGERSRDSSGDRVHESRGHRASGRVACATPRLGLKDNVHIR